ncbi:hypothetical protein HPQ68_23875 [Massilia sp. erpn]|nr:hypothetical protein HPQ68_23875 [Massilia sp. erpn]
MKEKQLDTKSPDQKLQERLMLARAAPDDRLLLADTVLLAALDGSRPLSPGELAALQASPLTLRRFRHLALERRARSSGPVAANDPVWSRSHGMLRAAATAAALDELVTDDGCWSLHFLAQGAGWQVILKLHADAPFAPRVMRELPLLRVSDGGGAVLLQGRLDADGECERAWPHADAPAEHFQRHGAVFAVEAVEPAL